VVWRGEGGGVVSVLSYPVRFVERQVKRTKSSFTVTGRTLALALCTRGNLAQPRVCELALSVG